MEPAEVKTFLDDLFEGNYCHIPSIYRDFHSYDIRKRYPINSKAFQFIIRSAFALERYDIVLYYRNNRYFDFEVFNSVYNYTNGIQFCLDNDIPINYNKLFTLFCQNNNIESIKYIIEKTNIVINKNHYSGYWNFLHIASLHHSCEIIEYLVNNLGFDVNQVDKKGKTCLMLCIEMEDYYDTRKALLLLLNLGANKDVVWRGKKVAEMTKIEVVAELINEYQPLPDIKEPECN